MAVAILAAVFVLLVVGLVVAVWAPPGPGESFRSLSSLRPGRPASSPA
jgi:hypothetical protein